MHADALADEPHGDLGDLAGAPRAGGQRLLDDAGVAFELLPPLAERGEVAVDLRHLRALQRHNEAMGKWARHSES